MSSLSRHERADAMQVLRTSSAPSALTPRQDELARDLAAIHGDLKIAQEASGLHFYIACPQCLMDDGEQELWKMHLAINVDKHIQGANAPSRCMKTGKVYRVDELLSFPPLEKRGYSRGPGKVVDQNLVTEETHEVDPLGRWMPKGPGCTTVLTLLPEDHPCLAYLHSRNFSPAELERQFGACYCYDERKDLHYRRLINGFKASPMGRLVLPIWQKGLRAGWQARILDIEDELNHYFWNPWQDMWVCVETRETPESPWNKLPGWEEWDPPKYLMARGARRNQAIMGYDAAVAWNRNQKRKFCYALEGPLDAGRLGPPAVALCGKVCSQKQAALLEEAFETIIVVPDNDEAGSKLFNYIYQWIGTTRRVVQVKPPLHRKDAGDMLPMEAKAFRFAAMHQAGL